MIRTVASGPRCGTVQVPSSKSQLHRLLILAAFGRGRTVIGYDGLSKDIAATIACLNGLGAQIEEHMPGLFDVRPIDRPLPQSGYLPCGESGSTLRFLLPLAGVLGVSCGFQMEGRLPDRPMAPFEAELEAHGMSIARQGELLRVSNALKPGVYRLPGGVSSQYISGLLMALPLLEEDSELIIEGRIESSSYIAMTEEALRLAGIHIEKSGASYRIPGLQRPSLPAKLEAEGDWSGAAPFLCMGALSQQGIEVRGLHAASAQGDRAVLDILQRMGAEIDVTDDGVRVRRGGLRAVDLDASDVPDLVPAVAALAAAAEGCTRISGAARLRLKESDRLQSLTDMLSALGADVQQTDDGLIIKGKKKLRGGRCSSAADHRIAMAAAVAAGACRSPVRIEDSECVAKSYPRFFGDLDRLVKEQL